MTMKNRVELASVVVQAEGILVSKIDDEVVMMSVEHGTYSGLDAIGSEIWALLQSPRQVSEICALLLKEYQVERRQCETDVLAFLNDLASEHIIKVVNAAE